MSDRDAAALPCQDDVLQMSFLHRILHFSLLQSDEDPALKPVGKTYFC